MKKTYLFFKRFLDILISFLGIIICILPALIVALLVKVTSKGPILYKQERIGKNGKVFNILKFRSMVVGAESSGVYSSNKDPRVTKIGKFLRATSIDEIPQLINILKGDMSLIGPRPPLTYHPWTYDKYTNEQKKMFDVRPGITGWAQVHGRKDVEWHKRIEYNVWYVDNVSFWLDIKIFFLTIVKVLKNEGNENDKKTAGDNKHLKLMYITNDPEVALIAESAGVDRIFVDLEYIGKEKRQGDLDTVKSHHTIKDIVNIRKAITKSELIVRCNPIHKETEEYCSSKEEIKQIIKAGADIIMLPYFKNVDEVKEFVSYVNGKVKTMLLFETKEAVENVDEILDIKGIDYVHIGLNDLSLSYHKKFMFELLSDGTVEMLCNKFKEKDISYGFGGIASLGKGDVPSEKVILEHYRLGSSCAILSRSFCNTQLLTDKKEIRSIFNNGIKEIREFEFSINEKTDFEKNRVEINELIKKVADNK